MKNFICLSITILALICSITAQNTGTFTDKRDKKVYKTIQIGDQIWFAENICYASPRGEYDLYDGKQENMNLYGLLYSFETAKNVCPDGWHLPDDSEWKTLELFIGMPEDEFDLIHHRAEPFGNKLKSKSGWSEDGNGTDELGFNALPAGACLFYDNSFNFIEEKAYFWTSTTDETYAIARVISYDETEIKRASYARYFKMSVRCVKNK